MKASRDRAGLLAVLVGLFGVATWTQREALHALWSAETTSPSEGPATSTRSSGTDRDPFEPSRESLEFRHDTASATVDTQGRTALDGMDLPRIMAFRRSKVAEHASLALFPSRYEPLEGPARRIWGSITPGVKWLGPTPYYVANPYVLIVMVLANHVTPLSLFCPEVEFRYTHRRIEEIHRGDAARCWLDRAFEPPYADHPGQLRVIMVNAFDAGLHHAHVSLDQSANLAADPSPGNVLNGLFEQSSLFHVGRYQANNISPEDHNGWIRLLDRRAPTRIHVKLWVRPPASTDAPADMTYVVEVRP